MQLQTERRLAAEALDRIGRSALPEAEATMAIDGRRYTCETALADEIAALFRRQPLPLAFGCEIEEPGDYLTLDIAGVPVLLIRDDDGTVRGLLNTCRHRGARLLDGAGRVGKAFVCPYHNWAYDRCGVLRAQPAAEHFPGITVGEEALVRFPTEERDGFVWLLLDPAGTLDLDDALGPLGPELAAFGLADYRHRGSHDWTKRMNWKLGVDTFLEYYHVPILHRASIGKTLFGTVFLYEACGRHARLVAPRRSIVEQQGGDPATLARATPCDNRLPALPQRGVHQPGPARRARALLPRPRAARHHGLPLQLRLARRRRERARLGGDDAALRSACSTPRTSP